MKILLTIGHIDILLPDDTGITTILKTLSKGIIVRDRLYLGEEGSLTFESEVQVEMKTVPRNVRVTGLPGRPEKKAKALALPEPTSILL